MRVLIFGIAIWLWAFGVMAQSVQVIGDSILDWNSWLDVSVMDQLEEKGFEVAANATGGAHLVHPNPFMRFSSYDIRAQFENGNWDWVVIDGGGNDLMHQCGCGFCDMVLDGLVTANGQDGAMPILIERARETGAKIILMGYYLGPLSDGPLVSCREEFVALNSRYKAFASQDPEVYFLDVASLIPQDALTRYDFDMLHPSKEGSQILADAIADIIWAH